MARHSISKIKKLSFCLLCKLKTLYLKRINHMKQIQKYFLFLLHLTIMVSLCFGSQYSVSAQTQAQATNEVVSPPLFSDLTWENSENIQKDVHVNNQILNLSGDKFAAVEIYQNGIPESVFDYYSAKNLESLGWTSVGHSGFESTYWHSSGRYLTVEIFDCPNSKTEYCVNVWQSVDASKTPPTVQPSAASIMTAVAFSKASPVNTSTISLPSSSYRLLQWEDAQIGSTDRYQYCIDQTNNQLCDSNNWITRNSLYSGEAEFTLSAGHTYYWQVRVRDAGIYANSGTWWSFTISNNTAVVPVVSSNVRTSPSSSYTSASIVSFTVTFSTAVTGVDVTDFAVVSAGITGASVTGVTGSGTTYLVTVNTGTGNGMLRLDVTDNDSITNSIGTPLGGIGAGNGEYTIGPSYVIDKNFPTVSSSTPSTAATTPGYINFTVSFSEAVTGVDIADFSATVSGLSSVTVYSVSGSGTVYTVSVNVGTGAIGSSGTIRLDVIDNDTIKDSAANLLGGTGTVNGNFTSGTAYRIWSGSVSITSDKNVVTVARPHIGSEISSYSGVSAGALTSYIPMLFKGAYGGTYDSAFYVQNVGSTTANITIDFYTSATGSLFYTKTDTITGFASKSYWLPSDNNLPAGWVGSVVVTSSQPIVTIGRPHIGAEIMSYDGFTSGSTTAYIPMLFKNAYGGSYDSAFYIQNVDPSATADITIKFYDSLGVLSCTQTDTIVRLASKGYWLPGLAADCIPDGWVGGVVVTSSTPIVTVGRPHIGTQITTYDGFSAGSLDSYIPMLFKGAFGGTYNAAFYIQNLSGTTANITIRYYDNSGSITCTKTGTVAALASVGYWTPTEVCLPTGWVGGMVVSSDQPIVAVGRPHIGAQITTYNGLTAGSLDAYLPMLFKDAFGGAYDSAFYIQNTETSTAAVTIKLYDSTGALSCTLNQNIAALSTYGLWLPGLTCP
jgi:hypothetical protein